MRNVAEVLVIHDSDIPMATKQFRSLIPAEAIERSIFEIRGHKVLLDADLAHLYGVEIKALNQAVKRNLERFPDDFMFQLTHDEWDALWRQIDTIDAPAKPAPSVLRSQIVTLNAGRGQHRRRLASRNAVLALIFREIEPRFSFQSYNQSQYTSMEASINAKSMDNANIRWSYSRRSLATLLLPRST